VQCLTRSLSVSLLTLAFAQGNPNRPVENVTLVASHRPVDLASVTSDGGEFGNKLAVWPLSASGAIVRVFPRNLHRHRQEIRAEVP